MNDLHLSRELLRAIANGDLPPRAFLEMVLHHLFEFCPHCAVEWHAYESEKHAHTGASGYDSAFSLLSHVLAHQLPRVALAERAAERDFRDLMRVPPELRARRILRSYRRFRGAALAERLIAECRRCVTSRPREAHEFAFLAQLVTNQSSEPASRELSPLSMAEMANATRAGGDLSEADKIFMRVRKLTLLGGVIDPAVSARIDSLEGSLRKDQRRFKEAEEILSRAQFLYEIVGESAQVGRVHVQQATVYFQMGSLTKALSVSKKALSLLTPEEDRFLYFFARRLIAIVLVDLDRLAEAIAILDMDEREHRTLNEPLYQIRYSWLRGRIAAARGDLAAAERLFVTTRGTFMQAGIGFDAAMVSLDLALAYLKNGQTAQTKRLAEQIKPLFEAQDMHREAIAALLLFCEAAEQESLTISFVRELAKFLEAARADPSYRFRPPS